MEREDVFVLSIVAMAIMFMLGSLVSAKLLMLQW
jgi:hypothetical protein